ncbi:hypothetical protein M1349_03950 [Patescibacteria group bacterium]|nr:hypothetical protein [Patescibacteria group bacterium]
MPSLAESGYCPPEFSLKVPHDKGLFLFYTKNGGREIKALTEIDDTGTPPRPLTPEEANQASDLVTKFCKGEKMIVDFSTTMEPSRLQDTLTQIRDILASTAKQNPSKPNEAILRPVFT